MGIRRKACRSQDRLASSRKRKGAARREEVAASRSLGCSPLGGVGLEHPGDSFEAHPFIAGLNAVLSAQLAKLF